jgi:hypothetical protein
MTFLSQINDVESGSIGQRHGSPDPDPYKKMSQMHNTGTLLGTIPLMYSLYCNTSTLFLLIFLLNRTVIFICLQVHHLPGGAALQLPQHPQAHQARPQARLQGLRGEARRLYGSAPSKICVEQQGRASSCKAASRGTYR